MGKKISERKLFAILPAPSSRCACSRYRRATRAWASYTRSDRLSRSTVFLMDEHTTLCIRLSLVLAVNPARVLRQTTLELNTL